MTQRVVSISFPAKWTEPSPSSPRPVDAQSRIDVANFFLGRGPCGKTVVKLQVVPNGYGLEITQAHSDGTQKAFFYQWQDVLGRVEVETGPSGIEDPIY